MGIFFNPGLLLVYEFVPRLVDTYPSGPTLGQPRIVRQRRPKASPSFFMTPTHIWGYFRRFG